MRCQCGRLPPGWCDSLPKSRQTSGPAAGASGSPGRSWPSHTFWNHIGDTSRRLCLPCWHQWWGSAGFHTDTWKVKIAVIVAFHSRRATIVTPSWVTPGHSGLSYSHTHTHSRTRSPVRYNVTEMNVQTSTRIWRLPGYVYVSECESNSVHSNSVQSDLA